MSWPRSPCTTFRARRAPVLCYVLAISAMVAFSFGAVDVDARSFLLPAGALAFYCSDIFVARERFVVRSPWNARLGLPLYYGAQLAIVAGASA